MGEVSVKRTAAGLEDSALLPTGRMISLLGGETDSRKIELRIQPLRHVDNASASPPANRQIA